MSPAGPERGSPSRAAARLLGLTAIVALPVVVLWPWLGPWSTLGFHDWDVMAAHRELARRAILERGALPGWNPYACGGFPAWGYVEGATVVVSPWLPLYLGLPMAVAIRLEVLGATLLCALGCWVAAGRLTASSAARLLVVAAFAVNGRWGLQAAAGHTWHLAYALTPWCFAALDRAIQPGAGIGPHVALGLGFALLVYAGGIYPLPHTALLLGLYAATLGLSLRSVRPLTSLALGGALGAALSAPKLLPVLATFARAPRAIESTERFDPRALLVALTSRQQGFFDRPAPVSPYGWHEWGTYVGPVLLALLALGAAAALRGRDPRARALAVAAVALSLLALGDFHHLSPWHLLHAHAPFFGSMHVPSRFTQPALLALALAAAAEVGAWLERREPRHPVLAPLAAGFALGLGVDVALVAQLPMRQSMWMVPPRAIARRPFDHQPRPTVHYERSDWAPPLYLPMLANQGVLSCYGVPPFEGRGARGAADPDRRGLVEIGGREAPPPILSWSPDSVRVDVAGAAAGERLIYDMNFDPGWGAQVERTDGAREPAEVRPDLDRPSVVLPEGAAVVELRYRPPGLDRGLWIAASAAAGATLLGLRERRRRRRAERWPT